MQPRLLLLLAVLVVAAGVAAFLTRYTVVPSPVDTVAWRLDRWTGEIRVIEYDQDRDAWITRDAPATTITGRFD